MSGTNSAVMSSIVGKKGSEASLTSALSNANEMAIKMDDAKGKKVTKKK